MGAQSSSPESQSGSDDDSGSSGSSSTGIEDFIVDEEDADAKKIVDEFVEQLRSDSAGMRYHLKVRPLFSSSF
jgi:hypothetical protein